MVAQFQDHNSLTRAYTELLRIGVPDQRIAPYFEPAQAQEPDESEHRSFLKQLHTWVSSSRESPTYATEDPPDSASLMFRSHGGTLNIQCPQLESPIMDIIIRHGGQLVG